MEDQQGTSSDDMPSSAGVTLSNLFRHPQAHPIALDLCLLKKYGPEWFGWEWETLHMRIPQDFKGGLSWLNLSKIMAVSSLHLVDTYWHRWEVFGWVTMAFNGLFADFDVLQKPSAIECLISVDIANRIRTDVEWSPDLLAYLAASFRYDGLLCPIPPCDFVPMDLKDLGTDYAEVKEKWPQVRDSRRVPKEESVNAEQLRRMLVAHDAVEENRALLRHQLLLVDYV